MLLKFLAYIAAAAVMLAFPPLCFAFLIVFVLMVLWDEIKRDSKR